MGGAYILVLEPAYASGKWYVIAWLDTTSGAQMVSKRGVRAREGAFKGVRALLAVVLQFFRRHRRTDCSHGQAHARVQWDAHARKGNSGGGLRQARVHAQKY